MVEQKSTTLLDSGTFTHRVTNRQPIEYRTEGLKNMEGHLRVGVPRPHEDEDEIPLRFKGTIA